MSGSRALHAAWRRWRALPRDEQRATVALTTLIPAAAVAVRLLGVDATVRLTTASRRRVGTALDIQTARRALGRVVARAPYRGNCLSQSLAMAYWLGRRGIATTLKLGVQVEGGALQAHAWVERDGVALTTRGAYSEAFSLAPQRPEARWPS